MSETSNLETARRYLRAIETGDLARMRSLFDPEIEQVEFPNLLKPNGERRTLAAMAADGERGRTLLSEQSYEIRSALAVGEQVALEVFWRGVLAIPLAGLEIGAVMTAHSAMFLQFRDGLIVAQRNYDCFPPLKGRV